MWHIIQSPKKLQHIQNSPRENLWNIHIYYCSIIIIPSNTIVIHNITLIITDIIKVNVFAKLAVWMVGPVWLTGGFEPITIRTQRRRTTYSWQRVVRGRTFCTCHGVFWSTELFPQLVHIIRVDLLIQSAAKPLRLGMVQHRCHRVRHVDHPARLCSDHKQEAVRCLQDQMLQFLQGAEGHIITH